MIVSTLGLDVNACKIRKSQEEVFLTPPRYADQYSTLYDRCGTIVCHPDGGFTGRGDGQCPDFFDSATGRTSIWPTR